MKTLGLLLATISEPLRRWNLRIVAWLLTLLVVLVTVFSASFHSSTASHLPDRPRLTDLARSSSRHMPTSAADEA